MRAAMALAIGLLGLALGRIDPVLAATQGEALLSEVAANSARLTLVWPQPAAVTLTVVGRVAALHADQLVAPVPADRLAALADWLDGAASAGDGRSLLLKLRRGVRASLDRPQPRMAVIALVRTNPAEPPVLARLPAIAVEPAAGPARLPPIPVSRPAVEAADPVASLPAAASSDATPASAPVGRSRVIVSAEHDHAGVRLRFRWDGPVPAAIFRRGDRLWVAFPADGTEVAGWRSLDRPEIAAWLQPLGTAAVGGVRSFRLRMTRPAEIRAEREANGWTVALLPAPDGRSQIPAPGVLRPDRRAGTLVAIATGKVAQLRDPDSGERLGLLMAAQAMHEPGSARLVDLELLPSVQGLVWRVLADGVRAAVADGQLIVSRPGGLRLAPSEATSANAPSEPTAPREVEEIAAPHQNAREDTQTAPLGLSVPATSNATEREGERRRIVEGLPALAGLPRAEARLALARLYLADALGPEARTALELIDPGDIAAPGAKAQRLSSLALSGVAEALTGRADPALGKLLDHALDDDREVALWRAYAAALASRRDLAGQEWARSGGVPDGYPDPLRRRLGLELAAMLLDGADPAAATALLERLKALALPPDDAAKLQLLQGSAMAKAGDFAGADRAYAAAATGDPDTAVRAAFLRSEARLAGGAVTAPQALTELDGQSAGWGGHPWEARMLDRLAQLQADQGEAVAAIGSWRAAVARSSEPAAAAARTAQLRRHLKAVLADGTQPAVLRLALQRAHGELLADDPDTPRLRRQLGEIASGLGLAETAARLTGGADAVSAAASAEPAGTFESRRAAAVQRDDWAAVATLAEAELADVAATGALPPAKSEAVVWLGLAQARLGRLPAAASVAERYRGRIAGATEQALLGLATQGVPPAVDPGALADAEAGFAAALKAGLATLPVLQPAPPVRTAAAR